MFGHENFYSCVCVWGGGELVTSLCINTKGRRTERKDEKNEDLSYFRNARGNEEMKPHLPTYLPTYLPTPHLPPQPTTISRLGGGFRGNVTKYTYTTTTSTFFYKPAFFFFLFFLFTQLQDLIISTHHPTLFFLFLFFLAHYITPHTHVTPPPRSFRSSRPPHLPGGMDIIFFLESNL